MDNCYLIDLGNTTNDPKILREKIYSKVSTNLHTGEELGIYYKESSPTTHMDLSKSIDDMALVEICSNPDSLQRSNMVIDKKRNRKIETLDIERDLPSAAVDKLKVFGSN